MRKVSRASEQSTELNYVTAGKMPAARIESLSFNAGPETDRGGHVRILGPESAATDLPPIGSAEEHEGDEE